jgi:hypothetical protein
MENDEHKLNDSTIRSNRPIRRHGFQRPLHKYQFIAWFVLGMATLIFIVFVPALLPLTVSILMSVFYTI